MAENFRFYSQTYDALPKERMRELAGEADFAIEQAEDGRRVTLIAHFWVTGNYRISAGSTAFPRNAPQASVRACKFL
jgi:hypothetical protein